MRKLIKFLIPPQKWKLPVIVLLGIMVGLALYMFRASNAVSYLSDEPETCINCHVMIPQYAAWSHSSHREHAHCNDCHVPHNNFFNKYMFKAKDGMRHATMFTLRLEPEAIVIKDAGAAVVQENCKRCHEHTNEEVAAIDYTFENAVHGEGKLCWDCHREVPHGGIRSLSSTPHALVPEKKYTVPSWLKDMLEPKPTKN
jgi:cytochrome c nitrite reductase small subunit